MTDVLHLLCGIRELVLDAGGDLLLSLLGDLRAARGVRDALALFVLHICCLVVRCWLRCRCDGFVDEEFGTEMQRHVYIYATDATLTSSMQAVNRTYM